MPPDPTRYIATPALVVSGGDGAAMNAVLPNLKSWDHLDKAPLFCSFGPAAEFVSSSVSWMDVMNAFAWLAVLASILLPTALAGDASADERHRSRDQDTKN